MLHWNATGIGAASYVTSQTAESPWALFGKLESSVKMAELKRTGKLPELVVMGEAGQ